MFGIVRYAVKTQGLRQKKCTFVAETVGHEEQVLYPLPLFEHLTNGDRLTSRRASKAHPSDAGHGSRRFRSLERSDSRQGKATTPSGMQARRIALNGIGVITAARNGARGNERQPVDPVVVDGQRFEYSAAPTTSKA